jgi:hypothetical protein
MRKVSLFLRLKCLHFAAAFLAAVIAGGCSVNPPTPLRCDGSDRHAVNAPMPTAATLVPSKSCSTLVGSLGSRDSG